VSLPGLLNDIVAAARLQAEYSGLQHTVEPIDPGLWVNVDPQLLSSAVTNLLSNAFKYTPRGGDVIVRVRGADGRVAIEIQDYVRMGIPESAGDLFQPFGERRAKDRTGLGLGLSIARRAVRTQGGDIEVRNTPGKGCTFVIVLPAATVPVVSDVVGEPAS
jgi:signal transduction histidine kinase